MQQKQVELATVPCCGVWARRTKTDGRALGCLATVLCSPWCHLEVEEASDVSGGFFVDKMNLLEQSKEA